MAALLLLAYAAVCVLLFKILRVPTNKWTVTTADGADAAHWEHSVAVHDDGIWVLTAEDGGAAGLAPLGVTPVPIAGA